VFFSKSEGVVDAAFGSSLSLREGREGEGEEFHFGIVSFARASPHLPLFLAKGSGQCALVRYVQLTIGKNCLTVSIHPIL
jgi:hypothetical protein